ncbi:hypothetical protein A2U01_0083848, partial [Trifolium medium]|nr:hypothetical protein [Trifolium medium]
KYADALVQNKYAPVHGNHGKVASVHLKDALVQVSKA